MPSDGGVMFDLFFPGHSHGLFRELFRELRSEVNGFLNMVAGLDKLQKLNFQILSVDSF